MQGAEQRTVCSICGPDQSIWHSEQKGTVDDHRALWLHPKVPQQVYPTAQRQVQPSYVEQWPFWILPHHQWYETKLCSDTDSVQHLFQHDLKQIIEDLDDDGAVYICYCFDGSLFNLRTLHVHANTLEQLFHDLLFADDAALITYTERALQYLTSCFAEAAQLFKLEVSLKKSEVLHQPAPLEEYHPPHITIGGTELKAVHQFTYLGCTITSDAKIDREVDNRLAKANSTFSRLYKRL